jgi:hypothetical protein
LAQAFWVLSPDRQVAVFAIVTGRLSLRRMKCVPQRGRPCQQLDGRNAGAAMEVVIGGAEPPRAVFLEELTKAVVEVEPWSEMTRATVPMKMFAVPTALQEINR